MQLRKAVARGDIRDQSRVWHTLARLVLACNIAVPLASASAPQVRAFTEPLPAAQPTMRGNAGESVAVGQRVVAVGAPGESIRGPGAGSVHIYNRDATTGAYTLLQTLQPPTLMPFDRFGGALSINGNLLIIGAKGDDTVAPNSGAAYVFQRPGIGQPYVYLTKLTPPTAAPNDCFGQAVSVIGNRLAVGAPRADIAGFNTGAAYVYTYDFATSAITPDGVVTDPAATAGDEFGSALAVFNSELVVASEMLDKPGGPLNCGGVVSFVRTGSAQWVVGQRLFATAASEDARFGASLAFEPPRPGSIGTLVVGAPTAGPTGAIRARGSVTVFTASLGSPWSQVFEYGYFEIEEGSSRGESIAYQNGRIIAGTPNRFDKRGGADLFERDGQGNWSFVRSIFLPGMEEDDYAGASVGYANQFPILGVPARELGAVDDAGEVWSTAAIWAPLGVGYCVPAVPNSTGHAATLAARGTAEPATQDFFLEAGFLRPNQFGFAVMSATPGVTVAPGGSDGNLCLSGQLARFGANIGQSGAGGRMTISLDLSNIPPPLPSAVQAGQTWWFQVWYRDLNPLPASNFTSAIGVRF